MIVRLGAIDLGVIGLYLAGITGFGLRFGRAGKKNAASADAKEKTLRGYFLADRSAPWWAIALSIVSAETSTLTIIGTPGLAFAGDFGFLQIVLGYMCGRIAVALLFLPKYFRGEMLTAYQLIDRRFSTGGPGGKALYKLTAGLFLVTRAAAEGVRVFAVSIVVGLAIGTGDILSIAIIAALTLLYTFEGGMAAVIWTDVVQMAIYIGGTLVAMWSLGHHVPGGWTTIHTAGAAASKFHMLNFALNLTTAYTFWAGLLGGTFLTMASHGTDQLMVQRLLAARNLKESRLALLSSGVVIFIQFTLFLLIGAGLWVFYGMHPASLAAIGGSNGNRIFPGFIVNEMPRGIAGLLVAAILAAAMSNLSAALNSLSASSVVDFYMGWRPFADERERMLVSRASTVLWASVLFAVAIYAVRAGGKGNVVEIGLSIASVAYGCLLGVFLLGTLTRSATQAGAIAGMISGLGVNLLLWRWPGLLLPHVAWTWYVLIGAAVTYVVGLSSSTLLRITRQRSTAALCITFILAATLSAQTPANHTESPTSDKPYDFSPISSTINQAISAHKLPGAVVVIGHGGHIVFEQAYGVRKLAGEPGLDGKPSPAEPMTTDTIFDMASLTKCLVTTTAIMQLAEQGKLDIDATAARYLPEFAANGKDKITIRELLTHYSGLPPDVDLTDPWGLASPNKAEGIRRAINAKPDSNPGTKFVYSDINFIVLGALVEKLSGERLDIYAARHIFKPLEMSHTSYLPFDMACGRHAVFGSAIAGEPDSTLQPLPSSGLEGSLADHVCGESRWSSFAVQTRTAPTQHDDQGTAETNPNFDHLLRGTVHDPTVRRMGGVAGQAGVFSTADDTAKFAQALLDKLLRNNGPFPLKQATLQKMALPQQPPTALAGATIFRQDGTTTTGIAQRGFGWDINSAYSRPRGSIFRTTLSPNTSHQLYPSFGHTGFTGTSLWIDPSSGSYVVLLANSVHARGGSSISPLRGEVATAAAKALHLDDTSPTNPEPTASNPPTQSIVKTGIDVLEADGFRELKQIAARHHGHLRLGLLTNQTGLDAAGRRTIDILRQAGSPVEVARLFSPEHGLFGTKDSEHIGPEIDTTGLKVTSLYGAKETDRRPKPEDLKDLDAVVIDLQDAGVRFYTYETITGYFIQAAQAEQAAGHALEIVVLDRPAMIGGLAIQGPVSNTPASYINFMPEPLRTGMTLGELAQYMQSEAPSPHESPTPPLKILTVIPMQGWHRSQFFDETGVPWVNPSPNLRSITEALLYPALGILDATNVSVGRGTPTPFELVGADWIDGATLASYLSARKIPGVTFTATRFNVADTPEKYPAHGQTVEGVHLTVIDRLALDSPELGIEILAALHHLYPKDFPLQKAAALVANTETISALEQSDDPRIIASRWSTALDAFAKKREKYLLYK